MAMASFWGSGIRSSGYGRPSPSAKTPMLASPHAPGLSQVPGNELGKDGPGRISRWMVFPSVNL